MPPETQSPQAPRCTGAMAEGAVFPKGQDVAGPVCPGVAESVSCSRRVEVTPSGQNLFHTVSFTACSNMSAGIADPWRKEGTVGRHQAGPLGADQCPLWPGVSGWPLLRLPSRARYKRPPRVPVVEEMTGLGPRTGLGHEAGLDCGVSMHPEYSQPRALKQTLH